MRQPSTASTPRPAGLPAHRPAAHRQEAPRAIVAKGENRRRRRTTHGEKLLTVAQLFDGRRTLPMIRMRGDWLRQLGFLIGRRVVVSVERDRIVLTPASEE